MTWTMITRISVMRNLLPPEDISWVSSTIACWVQELGNAKLEEWEIWGKISDDKVPETKKTKPDSRKLTLACSIRVIPTATSCL